MAYGSIVGQSNSTNVMSQGSCIATVVLSFFKDWDVWQTVDGVYPNLSVSTSCAVLFGSYSPYDTTEGSQYYGTSYGIDDAEDTYCPNTMLLIDSTITYSPKYLILRVKYNSTTGQLSYKISKSAGSSNSFSLEHAVINFYTKKNN